MNGTAPFDITVNAGKSIPVGIPESIAYTAVCYSYKKLGGNEHPHTMITLLWCLLLIVLPIALVFSESSMGNIQSVSIISAFPIGMKLCLLIW